MTEEARLYIRRSEPVFRILEIDGLYVVEQGTWLLQHMTINAAEAERAVGVLAKLQPVYPEQGRLVAEYDAQGWPIRGQP